MGGVVATAYSSRYPVRGVVNVDQPLNVTPLPDSVKQAVSGRGFELFMTDLFGQLYGDPDPVIAETSVPNGPYDKRLFSDTGGRCSN